uniref:Uncharacterized protein n=1 Tax=Avena sativa TaxID=4498 RepID=A0ACD5VW66_AVESA
MDLSVERLKLSDADGGGEDRLSDLPDDVLIHILALVADAADAAGTSILASRWRRLWALLPELSFHYIEHHAIGAVLAAHEAPDLTLLVVLTDTEDASPESLSAWLPIAARALSGFIHLEVRRETGTEAEKRGAAIDLPCFEKATCIVLNLGFLGLALPPSGVFARLKELQLIGIQLHAGQAGLGDLISPERCPSLEALRLRDARDLDSLNIHSNSLLRMELLDLPRLQQLTVMAPALNRLRVGNCFTDPLNPDLSAADISAPQLTSLDWMNYYHPSSIQLDKVVHLETLGVQFYILDGEDEEEGFENNHYGMTLLQRFQDICNLDLMIVYPQGICTAPYLMGHMPRFPYVTFLALGVVAYGHSFGSIPFDVLRRCTGVKELDLDFVPEIQLEVAPVISNQTGDRRSSRWIALKK